jgi:ribulose-5-phosphate 4-epimerase/fuculose-1-phosphate aldolase
MLEGNRECGTRHKFTVRTRDFAANLYPAEIERLAYWCSAFDAEGLAPIEGGASAGNLSFRTRQGFVITPSRSLLKAGLAWRDFAEVVREDWDAYELHVLGERIPSSDSFLHGRIYAVRPDACAVFHGHDDLVLEHADELARELRIVSTPEAMLFGTRQDAIETARALGQSDYIIRKGHGFVAVGRTLDLAGERALTVHRRAMEIAARPPQ